MTENGFFRAFITLRSPFHLHHRSQRALTEIVSKITPNLGLGFKFRTFIGPSVESSDIVAVKGLMVASL